MRLRSLASLALILALPGAPADAADTLVLGAGVANCSSMLAAQPQLSLSWILGFWTGMNSALVDSTFGTGKVGTRMDAQNLIDSAKLICGQNPAYTLFQAAQLAFWRVAGSER